MNKNPFEMKIEKPRDIDWTQGRYLEYDQSSVDPRFGHDALDDERRPFNFRLLAAVFLLTIGGMVGRLGYLQIWQKEKYTAMAEGNRYRTQYLLAPRGLIYDDYGKTVVRNTPSFELVVTPLDLPSDAERLAGLEKDIAANFSLDPQALAETVASLNRTSFYPVTLKQGVEREKAIVFITRQDQYPGFSIQNNPQRDYQDAPVFSHILGYTGKLTRSEYDELEPKGYLFNDVVGKQGIESVYESNLRGIFGERLVEVDARGIVKSTFQEKPALPGSDLHLYLDYDLQKVLFDSLTRAMQKNRAKRAAAVAIDPRTGGVRALVSLPSFDNNLFAAGITPEQYQQLLTSPDLPLFNRVISGTYPPGSTVKPMVATGVLQENILSDTDKINDTGSLHVTNQFDPNIVYTFRGWKPQGLGPVDIYGAIAESSDIYFYTVGGGQKDLKIEGLGAERLASYMKRFFLGQITGIDLPNEKAGLIPTPDWKAQRFAASKIDSQWFLGDTYNMSIGQGFVLVTPLQMAIATAAIANGGRVMQPHVLKSITDRSGKTVEEQQPKVLNENFVQKQYVEAAQRGMRQAVTSGTARLLAALPIEIAGKTGTSQFDGSDLARTHAWFTSYAPYQNPEIALTILIEAGGEGNAAAVPVAKEVYDWYSNNRTHH